MRVFNIIAMVVLVLALGACGEISRIRQRQNADEANAYCRSLFADPRLAPIRGVVSIFQMPTLEMRSNADFITDEQRPAVNLLQELSTRCNARYRAVNAAYARLVAFNSPDVDVAQVRLYNQQISIGTYNQIMATLIGNTDAAASGLPPRPFRPVATASVDRPPRKPGEALALEGSGSGFFVSEAGHLVTNAHVAEECSETRIRLAPGEATKAAVVALDHANDLALLRLSAPHPAIVRFHAGKPVRQGDGVVVAGFPLSIALASGVNLSTGTVSALAGIKDDSRHIQISAPIQPGNSGGPVLDMSGNLIAVVRSKLDAVKVAAATGSLSENVNFAIKETVLRGFLETNGVTPVTATSTATLSAADIGERAKTFTVMIECWR